MLNIRIFYLVFGISCVSAIKNYNLNLDDILNDSLMPATLFLQPYVKGSNVTRKHFYSLEGRQNASSNVEDALNVMKFHRSKINEYMASNFIAKQIVSSLALNPVRMQRRLGIANQDLTPGYEDLPQDHLNRVKFPKIADPNSLLYDTGSSGYQQWLERTTTLDDIHRQFSMNASHGPYDTTHAPLNVKLSFKKRNRNGSVASTQSEETEERDDASEYEEGEITGYIYSKQNKMQQPESQPHYAQKANPNANYAAHNNDYTNVQQNNYAPQAPVNHVYSYHRPQTPTPVHAAGGGTGPSGTSWVHTQQQTAPTAYENPYQHYGGNPAAPTAKSKIVYYQNSVPNGEIAHDPQKHIVHQYSSQNFNYSPSSPSSVGKEPTDSQKKGYYHGPPVETYEHVEHHYPVETNTKKDITLKDVFDIVLTTLAFLSFGMFILQVLMCITMSSNTYSTSGNMMMMTPMETSAETLDDGVEEIRRVKRSVEIDRINKVNELSKRVLLSIDGLLTASEDNGKCLQRILCENNMFAREQKDGQKMWIPIWSLAVSWLMNTKGLALKSLKATAIGIGGGNCQTFTGCGIGWVKR